MADRVPGPESRPATPRWVKVFAIIVALAAILFVIVLLTGGPGGHGPSRHAPESSAADHTVRQA